MKFAFYTLGCKVNQYETQAMQQMLLADGHTLGEFDEICDGYIINTCTVTAVSDKKSRNAIRRVRRLNPNAVVGVCGCYAQANPDEIRKLDVDVLVGTADRRAFISHLEQAAEHKQKWEKIEDNRLGQDFEILPAGGLTARTRALLKVEDGCNNFCSYCIIPYARGRVRSMPLDAAVAEAQKLAAEGYREIVINGIEISSWGQEWKDGSVLRDLLAAICAAVPDVRIRLGSLEPRTIDEAFCRALAGFPNLCPQFHLSLQSGSDSVLRRMNRKYDTARYRRERPPPAHVFPRLRRHDRPDRRIPRRDGRGVPAVAGLCPRLRPLENSHLPVLAPRRHARRENVGSSPERSQGAARVGGCRRGR